MLQVLGWALLFLAMIYRSVYTLYEEWGKVLSVLADGNYSHSIQKPLLCKKKYSYCELRTLGDRQLPFLFLQQIFVTSSRITMERGQYAEIEHKS